MFVQDTEFKAAIENAVAIRHCQIVSSILELDLNQLNEKE